MMNDEKSKLLFEDLTQVANKWTAGISNRELKPRKLTLLDLLKGNQEENGKARPPPERMPAHGPRLAG